MKEELSGVRVSENGGSESKWFILGWITETLVLRIVFWGLLAGAVTIAVLDYSALYQRANPVLPGEETQRTPVVMEPPKQRDHVRPYLPRAMPKLPRGDGPTLPGFGNSLPSEAIGEKMKFARGPKGAASAVGRIELGTAGELAQFIEQQAGEIETLYLHSPGGSVHDALAMSKLLREKNIATVVPTGAYCASSCPIVFSGGKERTAGKPSWVGVHQIFSAANAERDNAEVMADTQLVSAEVQDHLIAMGVDPRAWLPAMRTPSAQIYIYTPEELIEYKLATKILS